MIELELKRQLSRERNRRHRARYREEINAKHRRRRAEACLANPHQPKPSTKIKKNCVVCQTVFFVFPCFARVKCCSRKCGNKIPKPGRNRLPTIRPCPTCGEVAEIKQSRCGACKKKCGLASYHRNKHRTTAKQKQRRNEQSRLYKLKRRHDPVLGKLERLRLREIEHRRRARKKMTRWGRVSYHRLLQSYGMLCHICDGWIADGDLSFDHVIPLARGGSHTEDNIKPAHLVCNVRKNQRLMGEI